MLAIVSRSLMFMVKNIVYELIRPYVPQIQCQKTVSASAAHLRPGPIFCITKKQSPEFLILRQGAEVEGADSTTMTTSRASSTRRASSTTAPAVATPAYFVTLNTEGTPLVTKAGAPFEVFNLGMGRTWKLGSNCFFCFFFMIFWDFLMIFWW